MSQYVYAYDLKKQDKNKWRAKWIKPMQCRQCDATTKAGKPCTRRVCFGLPYCTQHTKSILHLERKWTGAVRGCGLFATDKIPEGTSIPYIAEEITDDELEERYGKHTGPYTVATEDGDIYDAALLRGLPAYANSTYDGRREHFDGSINAELKTNPHDDMEYLVILRDIAKGEEILVNYEYEGQKTQRYWAGRHPEARVSLMRYQDGKREFTQKKTDQSRYTCPHARRRRR